MSQEMINISDK